MDAWSCPVGKVPEELARRGLRILSGEWPEGGQPTLYAALVQQTLPGMAPEAQKPEEPPVPLVEYAPRQSKLSGAIKNMLRLAAAHPGDVRRDELSGGLRIDLMVCTDGTTRLMIARRSVYPSDQEWCTLLAHWPYDVPVDVVPEKFAHNHWRCLRAHWETPERSEK